MKDLNIKLCIFLMISLFNCKLPDQPPLSEKEKYYFNNIEKLYNVKVRREIEPALLIKSEENIRGAYTLGVEIACHLLNDDTLKVQSFEIANYLYENILNHNSVYDEIVISYACMIGEDQYRTKIFEYKIDSLIKIKRDDNITLSIGK